MTELLPDVAHPRNWVKRLNLCAARARSAETPRRSWRSDPLGPTAVVLSDFARTAEVLDAYERRFADGGRRVSGIAWEELTGDKIAAVPVLARLAAERSG